MANFLLDNNLGTTFDLSNGTSVEIKLDSTLQKAVGGELGVAATALAISNALGINGDGVSLDSTVNGTLATLDLTPLVKAAEDDVRLGYNAATTELVLTHDGVTVDTVNLAALTSDIFIDGANYDPATLTLTLTDTDPGTPDVTINLGNLKEVVTANSNSIAFTGDGSTTGSALSASIVVDPAANNDLVVTTAGVFVDVAAKIQSELGFPINDAFGNPLATARTV